MTGLALLQTALEAWNADWTATAEQLRRHSPAVPPAERARHRMLIRLADALAPGSAASASDLAPLIRQVITSQAQALTLPPSLIERLGGRLAMSGLRVEPGCTENQVVKADAWRPEWLDDVGSIGEIQYRRAEPAALGDGMTQRVLGFPTYQSDAQKAAVLSSVFAPPGSTTLITLPTGSGKSLCAQLPAWMQSRGGGSAGHTTLLIVPTVALAVDQERQARELFVAERPGEGEPRAWLGDSKPEQRDAMERGLRNGTMPLLITSPEALMTGRLGAICLDAARHGSLTRLVIDEAHLIENWGASFRTDFQLLSTFQRKLLEASDGKLCTVLLSATVTRPCESLLRSLFDHGTGFRAVRANRLRPEPGIWFADTNNCYERRARVIEALRFAPRPAILYVTKPGEARDWTNLLRDSEGYQRIETFSGETPATERKRINREWQRDAIDVMVANSAFGLGVDKGDVRTVIHATLPENGSRYYQEIGRSGRDGCSAFALLCMEYGDRALARGLRSNSVISTDRAVDRLKGLRSSARMDPATPDRLTVDVETPPQSDPTMRRGELSREWNEHILLMLQRADVLRIADARIDFEAEGERRTFLLELEIRDHQAWRDLDTRMGEVLETARTAEREAIDREVDDLLQSIHAQLDPDHRRCVGKDFSQLYPRCALACGGCPACRRTKTEPYLDTCRVELELDADVMPRRPLSPQLRTRLGSGQRAIVTWDGHRDHGELRPLAPLLTRLVTLGMRQIVLPAALARDESWRVALIERLAHERVGEHLLIDDKWVKRIGDRPMFALPTVIVYPVGDEEADLLHQAVERRPKLAGQPVISIVHNDLFLRSLGGRFRDKQDGVTQRWQSFERDLEPAGFGR